MAATLDLSSRYGSQAEFLWEGTQGVPAERQAPLWSVELEGERALHYFETLPPEAASAQLLGLALLTQLVYPVFYDGLLGRQGEAVLVVATLVTALRNLALLAFTVEVCVLAWRALGASRAVGRDGESLPDTL